MNAALLGSISLVTAGWALLKYKAEPEDTSAKALTKEFWSFKFTDAALRTDILRFSVI